MKFLGASLVHLVRAQVDELVFVRLWVAWEYLFEMDRLVINHVLESHTSWLLVGNSPKAILCETSNNMTVVWVNDRVHIVVAEFLEGIVDLKTLSWEGDASILTHIRCNKLIIPSLPRKVPGSEH